MSIDDTIQVVIKDAMVDDSESAVEAIDDVIEDAIENAIEYAIDDAIVGDI